MLPPDDRWVEAVQKTAERIAALSRGPAPGALPGTAPARPDAGDAPLAEAWRRFGAERYGEVVALLANEPDRPSRLLRAAALLQGGRAGEAQSLCVALRDEDPLDADATCLLGLCREQFDDAGGARDLLQNAVYLDDAFAAPQLALARLARQRQDVSTRRRALLRAQQLLALESATRVLMFGGGFSADALARIAQSELAQLEVRS